MSLPSASQTHDPNALARQAISTFLADLAASPPWDVTRSAALVRPADVALIAPAEGAIYGLMTRIAAAEWRPEPALILPGAVREGLLRGPHAAAIEAVALRLTGARGEPLRLATSREDVAAVVLRSKADTCRYALTEAATAGHETLAAELVTACEGLLAAARDFERVRGGDAVPLSIAGGGAA